MRRLFFFALLVLLSIPSLGQTGVLPVYDCLQNGVQASTSGLKSTNYMQGIVPYCTVKVYLTGTTIIATTSPQTPLTANVNGSIPPISAAINQGYDVVFSGGISPNVYATPVTLTDIYPSQSLTPVTGVTSIIPGTNVTCSTEVSGSCTGAVTVNAAGGSSVNVNGSPVSNPNFNGSTPVAQTNYVNGTWQCTGSNCSVEMPLNAGNGVLYNPSTTVYYLPSSSILMDDSRALSSAVPVGTWSCDGTTCTVNTTSAHGYSTGDWVDLKGMTGWPNAGAWRTYVDVFQVAVTSTTQFTFPYTLSSPSGSGGNVYLATYWGAYQTANQPYFSGHGTFISFYSWAGYTGETTYPSLATQFSSLVNCSAGTPTYLMLQVGLNDIITGGRTAAQVEASLQSIWQQAHAAGCIVVQMPILNTHVGISDTSAYWVTVGQINSWITAQGITDAGVTVGNAAYQKYWDRYIGFNGNQAGWVGTNPYASILFATHVNEAFSNQSSSWDGNGGWQAWTSGNTALQMPAQMPFLDNDQSIADLFQTNQGATGYPRLVMHNRTVFSSAAEDLDQLFDFGTTSGVTGCSQIGSSANAASNSFRLCYNQVAYSSGANYLSIEGGNSPWVQGLKVFIGGGIQFPQIVAPSGTYPLVVDTSGNVSVGSSGGSGLSGMTAGQIPVAATSSTVTSSKALQGTDSAILTAGTVSGTSQLLCTDANGGATTSSCPSGSGVSSINSTAGAFTFSGSGVSCTGTTCTFSGSGSSAVGVGFILNTGVAASPAVVYQTAPHTGTISGCVFTTTTSDASANLVMNVKLAGTTIFTGSAITVTAGTAAETQSSFSLSSGSITVTAGNLWELDVTTGASDWTGSLQCQ